jgi:NAD-dependent SIR2 family protein deacetylase
VVRYAAAGNYKPAATHYFIKLLHDKRLLLRAFTQNIDSLEHEVRHVCLAVQSGVPGAGNQKCSWGYRLAAWHCNAVSCLPSVLHSFSHTSSGRASCWQCIQASSAVVAL